MNRVVSGFLIVVMVSGCVFMPRCADCHATPNLEGIVALEDCCSDNNTHQSETVDCDHSRIQVSKAVSVAAPTTSGASANFDSLLTSAFCARLSFNLTGSSSLSRSAHCHGLLIASIPVLRC